MLAERRLKPRKTWLDAQCPVCVDFGDEWLFQLHLWNRNRKSAAMSAKLSSERLRTLIATRL